MYTCVHEYHIGSGGCTVEPCLTDTPQRQYVNNCIVEPLMLDSQNTDIAIIWTNVQGHKYMPMHESTPQARGHFNVS